MQPFPIDPREWLREGHLAYFIYDAVEQADLSPFYAPYAGRAGAGHAPFDPRLMVKILLYGYIVGIRSSRELECALHEDVAFRFLGGGHFPNFRTIAAFRKRHFDDFSHLFFEVLQIAHKMGILKLGTVRLSVDGSKFKANASKLKSRVHKIVDEADKTDAKENTEQGKANDYINHLEASGQDSPESQADKIKKAYQAIRNEEAGSKNPEKNTDSEVEGTTEEKPKVLCSEQVAEQGSEQDGEQGTEQDGEQDGD